MRALDELPITQRGPFWAETASVKNDETWPYWIVRNKFCNVLGKWLPRPDAEKLAALMNEEQAR